jgi:hypothetical protein
MQARRTERFLACFRRQFFEYQLFAVSLVYKQLPTSGTGFRLIAKRQQNPWRIERVNRCVLPSRGQPMTKYKVGDHVGWNSEAGHVSGVIIKVHTRDTEYKGHTRRASPQEPQYEIRSDKTEHIAMHKEGALRKLE